MNTRRTLAAIGLIILHLTVVSSRAATIKSCDPAGERKVEVMLDGKTNVVSRYFCLVSDSDVKIIVDPSDFATAGNGAVIDQGNIRLAQETTLTKGHETKVLVNFGGLSKPGVYQGSTEFRGSEMTHGSGTSVRIELTLTPKPNVAILPT